MARILFCSAVIGAVLCAGCLMDEFSPAGDRSDFESIPTDDASLIAACENAVVEAASTSFGDPLPGLSTELLARFEAGKEEFEEVETPADGLGPVFNAPSCVECHQQGATGGGGTVVETRFGTRGPDGRFEPLTLLGGSLQQVQGITNGDCTQPPEVIPAAADVVAQRQTTPLFGLGLLDEVSERLLRLLADPGDANHDGISGRLNVVISPDTQEPAIGRFGWKSQVASLFAFSGDAYVNEMGITNNLFPDENAPQGNAAVCDDDIPAPEIDNEDLDGNGISDGVEAFTDFMRLLAPPPVAGAATRAVFRGARQFVQVGCARCHQPALVTRRVPDVRALSRRRFHPFTDLLLHDMGGLADGIEQGEASAREMRTAPLWGLRASAPYLHDGRAATILDAIMAHDGEGAQAREAFSRLSPEQRADLLAFLGFI
jgi:CxxC motif-containing protein (DUF1111 family)